MKFEDPDTKALVISLIIMFALIGAIVGIPIQLINARAKRAAQTQEVAAPQYNAPEISYEGRKPIGDKIDPATILRENNGYNADLDGDGIADLVILRGNTLYFSKRDAAGRTAPELPILVIKGSLIAYNLDGQTGPDGKPQFVLHFWNDNRDGFLQRCLGVNPQGIPYFGDVETE